MVDRFRKSFHERAVQRGVAGRAQRIQFGPGAQKLRRGRVTVRLRFMRAASSSHEFADKAMGCSYVRGHGECCCYLFHEGYIAS